MKDGQGEGCDEERDYSEVQREQERSLLRYTMLSDRYTDPPHTDTHTTLV